MPTLADLGIVIPDTRLAQSALALLNASSPAHICNHCLRTHAFGLLGTRALGLTCDPEVTFVAAALHDLGLVPDYMSEDQRFEIDSADVARRFMLEHDVPEEKADLVWDAIALHTTTGIPLRKAPEVAFVHIGAGMDVLGIQLDQLPPEVLEAVLDAHPRLGFKDAFRQSVIDYATRKPMAQIFTWTSDIAHAHVPAFQCPTMSEAYDAAPFAE